MNDRHCIAWHEHRVGEEIELYSNVGFLAVQDVREGGSSLQGVGFGHGDLSVAAKTALSDSRTEVEQTGCAGVCRWQGGGKRHALSSVHSGSSRNVFLDTG